jgi:hypothetical protein
MSAVNIDAIMKSILSLPEESRVQIVDRIIATITAPYRQEVERAWIEEVDRRVSAIERGEAKTHDAESILKRLERGERP